MTESFDYDRYLALLNAGDDATLCETYYHPDAVFITTEREVFGRDALKAFLDWFHAGVRETVYPLAVARTGDTVLAEVEIAFTAVRDWPEFPLAPIRAGETIAAKYAAVYELEDERVKRAKTWRWAAGRHIERAATD